MDTNVKPIQSSWIPLGRGHLCFAIVPPPNFAVTVELRRGEGEWEVALCIGWFSAVYTWRRRVKLQ